MSQIPPALIAEATKRAGLIWIVIEGQDRPRPAWHVWRAGAAYVVTGTGEQPLPGLAGAGRVTVIVTGSRASGSQASGGRVAWTAAVTRVEPGSGEWDEVIGQLVAGRLNAVLAEGETSPAQRWAASGAVFRLAPVDPPAPANTPAPPDTPAPANTPAPTNTPTPATTPAPASKRAPNSRTELPAAPRAVHPPRRLAGHRQRRQTTSVAIATTPASRRTCWTRPRASPPTDNGPAHRQPGVGGAVATVPPHTARIEPASHVA